MRQDGKRQNALIFIRIYSNTFKLKLQNCFQEEKQHYGLKTFEKSTLCQ